jgi:hypothetical protein
MMSSFQAGVVYDGSLGASLVSAMMLFPFDCVSARAYGSFFQ